MNPCLVFQFRPWGHVHILLTFGNTAMANKELSVNTTDSIIFFILFTLNNFKKSRIVSFSSAVSAEHFNRT